MRASATILGSLLALSVVMLAGSPAEAFIGRLGYCNATPTVPCVDDSICDLLSPGDTCGINPVGLGLTTDGEASAVQSGFYECKIKANRAERVAGTNLNRISEDTLLVLVNEVKEGNTYQAVPIGHQCACVILFSGSAEIAATGLTHLSPRDIDEINLCTMLDLAGRSAVGGRAGVVEVFTVVTDPLAPCDPANFDVGGPTGGSYAWIKNVLYKARTKKVSADPFTARGVLGVGKTELRVTPVAVDDGADFFTQCAGASLIDPSAYAEATHE